VAAHLRLTPEEAWERAKICTSCKRRKELRDFTKDANSKDGTRCICRSCMIKYQSRLVPKLPVDTPQQCKQCNEVKPATEYHPNKRSPTGLRKECKPCCRRRENDRKLRLRKSRVVVQRQEKLCTTCKRTKPASDFHKQSSVIDGLTHVCKDCRKLRYLSRQKTEASQKENRAMRQNQGKTKGNTQCGRCSARW
jgi:hypothetical protein